MRTALKILGLIVWVAVILFLSGPPMELKKLQLKLGGKYELGYEKSGKYFVGHVNSTGYPRGFVSYTEVSREQWEKLEELHRLSSPRVTAFLVLWLSFFVVVGAFQLWPCR